MQVFKQMRVVAGLLGLLVIVVATARVQGTQEAEPARETIVYSSIQPSNWDLYLFERPGSAPRRLTTDPGLDYNGVISPDGRWVVFTSERSGSPDLYVLDLQGQAAARPLVASPAMEDAAAISPDGRRLLFVSTRSGNADVFVLPFRPENPSEAGEATNLTRHAAGDYNPAFSPDGARILFSSSRDTSVATSTGASPPPTYLASELYVMQADGADVRRLTRHESWDGAPAWTPDGQSAVFYSQRDGEPRLYRTAIDGGEPEPISAQDEAALSPAFGPDGRLAFTARRDDRWTIVTSRLDGSDPRIESDTARDYWAPAYDPTSGRLLAHGPGPMDPASRFESDAPGSFLIHQPLRVEMPDRHVSLIGIRGYLPAIDPTSGEVATSEAFARLVASRPDGTGKRVILDLAGADRYRGPDSAWGPSWSKDGRWLAFIVGPPFASGASDVDIWKIPAAGGDPTNLTPDSDANDALPDFSPDGRRIVFRSMRDGNAEIYLMDADGTKVRRLTRNEATDTMPAFSSAGDRVAFTSFRDGNFELYTIAFDEDGQPGPPERLTRSPGHDMHPRFSPDDEWVLFTSQRGEFSDELPLLRVVFQPQPYGELHAIRLADRTVVRLTHNKWEDGPTAWVRDVPGLD
jgi:Tol biopolymer transport system component